MNEMNERISNAIEAAKASFWRQIGEHFPEASTGDLPPDEAFALQQAMSAAVEVWVDGNLVKTDLVEASAQIAEQASRPDQCV